MSQPFSYEIPDDTVTHLVDDGAEVRLLDPELAQGLPSGSALTSDFEHADALLDQSGYDPRTGQALSDLDQMTVLRHLQDRDDQKIARSVRTNPTSWNRGVIGGAVQVRANQSTTLEGDRVTAAFWPGEDREATIVTVTVAPDPLPPLMVGPPNLQIRPCAHIEWGCRGAKFSMDVDVGTGVQFTFAASSVYVSCFLDEGSDTLGNPIWMYAAIGFKFASKPSAALRTVYMDNMSSNETRRSLRKKMSSKIVGLTRSNVNSQITLSFYDLHAVLIGQQIIATGLYLPAPIYLGNDVAAVDVLNDTPANNVRLIYGIV